jgi:hypothetical protein
MIRYNCEKKTLCVCGLFNDAVSSSDYIGSNDRVINESKRMLKEAVVA